MARFRSLGILAVISAVVAVGACGDTDATSTTVTTTETTLGNATTTTQPVPTQTVRVAFAVSGGDCEDVALYAREVDAAPDAIETAFTILVAGPDPAEMAQGAGSIFSQESAETLRSVQLDDGQLVVDFTDFRTLIANASTSCGSMSLLAQLNTTAFQFEEVDRVRYEIEGSCDTFSSWLQRECMEYTRAGAEPAQA